MPRSASSIAAKSLRRLFGVAGDRVVRSLFERPPEPPATIEVAFDQAVYPVRIRRHPRARRYTLRLDVAAREVVLTMPLRGNRREAQLFAQKHGAWIAARLRRLPQAQPFSDGVEVPIRGEPHRIAHRLRSRGVVWTEMDDAGRRLLCVTGTAAHHNRRITDWLKRQARADLDRACRRYAQALGVSFKRIAVRDQTSRWGSCSTTGVLSFSWRLILAPPFVLDYLAAHEVAHLVLLNHSPRFWQLLGRINPDCERAKSWLDANGAALHRFGSGGTPAAEPY